ncbi:thiamine-phosphate kinase [Pelagibaculum spongiae]|uniref:Thiamine-monophosphate kinase n=1 Tax=Pelagibaculum spongiae TaxID=2080658 RepID=A0A2V1H2S2_9GAMM|nr:thiamine-phosphate kinase [Pelagibaculum spongiae]PVZ71518.1 thiamine-phosphate kinase [Pelagibaculum spongiae]
MAEFSLIEKYLSRVTGQCEGLELGIGDDCALWQPPAGKQLALSMDTLNLDVHFLACSPAHSIGHKALAVNLSDLAAMGAQPVWCSLALSLPDADELWLAEFCRGFAELAKQSGIALIGGDTTSGPLSITVQVAGLIEPGKALRRSNALAGDLICISDRLGEAACGLDMLLKPLVTDIKQAKPFIKCLEYPNPQLQLGQYLSERAAGHACLDLSDGLASDLAHICRASKVVAEVDLEHFSGEHLPKNLTQQQAYQKQLAGGDDYQLCFTLNASELAAVQRQFPQVQVIGKMRQLASHEVTPHIEWLKNGQAVALQLKGFEHFSK